MEKLIVQGGYDIVEFSSEDGAFRLTGENNSSGIVTDLDELLKAGTGLTPESPTEEFADGKNQSAGKGMKMSVRSANVDDGAYSAFALLKTAEEAREKMHFRFRNSARDTSIDGCDAAWDEIVAPNVTSTIDEADKKEGNASIKVIVGVAVPGNTVLVVKSMEPASMPCGAPQITMWFKSSVATQNGDLQLLIAPDDGCETPTVFNIPALPAGEWRKCSFCRYGDLTGGTIMSFGLKMITDLGAFTLHGDDLRIVGPHVVIRNVVPRAELELNEQGKHNALRVTGEAFGVDEAAIEDLNV
jgi:hypothetical protein